MQLRESDLVSALNPLHLEGGRACLAQGRVLSVQSLNRGSLIAGMVRGSGAKVHKQFIHLVRHGSGRLDVTGHCSCPLGDNCKHVAAVLLSLTPKRSQQRTLEIEDLRHELRYWLDRLKTVEQREQEEAPPERLLYLLSLETRFSGRFLSARTVKSRRLKNGALGAISHFDTGNRSNARFLRPADHTILGQLETGNSQSGHLYELRGGAGAITLEAILETGRCYWENTDGVPLMRGEPLDSPLAWELEADGSQMVCASHASPGTRLLPLAPPWYLDPDYATCGPIETGLPDPVAETLAAAPPVSLDQAEALARALENHFPDRSLPTPREPEIRQRDDVPPTPCLYLHSDRDTLYYPHTGQAWDDYAELRFDYAGLRVHPWDEEPQLLHRDGESMALILRHADTEISHFEQLLALGFEPDETLGDDDSLVLFHRQGESGWIDFMLNQAQELRRHGWRIDLDPRFRFQLLPSCPWYAEVEETPGTDGFRLELGMELAGERVNLLPALADYLTEPEQADDWHKQLEQPNEHPLLLPLRDGRLVQLPLARARKLINSLVELFEPEHLDAAGRLRLSRLHSARLVDLEEGGLGDGLKWQGGERLREFGRRLRDFNGIRPTAPPADLQTPLRPYQQKGLDWLQFLREFGLGGILADDMGLGKTIQVLAHLLAEKQAGRGERPSLVVTPTSLLANWRRETRRFTAGLRVLILHGPKRKALFSQINEHDLIITSYLLLARDARDLGAHSYHLLILDEAQHIKNPKTKVARTARALSASHRLCLTGKPMENHLNELWSQFHFLMPELLGDRCEFGKLFRLPIERHADQARGLSLRNRIAPFLLRREKGQVAAQLPAKTEIVSEVELSGVQRDLYEDLRNTLHDKVQREIERKGMQRSRRVILDALHKLRQVCCDPRLVKLVAARKVKQSAKLELLGEMLPELVQGGHRILLFSQSTGMLGLIEQHVAEMGLDYVKLTGRSRDRATPIERFQKGGIPLFLISLKAGDSGLKLSAADTWIHYDPWWNPEVERQATDCAQHIGQHKPVFVYKLLSRGTVEEKIMDLRNRKQTLADSLFCGTPGDSGWDATDLRKLFDPLE